MNLLGKDVSQLMPESIYLNNLLLHDINSGYEDPKKIRMASNVRFNPDEAGYIHPWSYENIGEQYGVNKLSEYIPLRDYLEMPAHSIDKVISGVIKGKDERFKMDEKRRQERAAQEKRASTANVHANQIDPMTAEILRQLEMKQE